MQLEIIPNLDVGKTGTSIPCRAFQATPEELDEQMPGFFESYAAGVADINEQIAQSNAAMQKAQEAAREEALKRQNSKSVAPAKSAATAAGAKPKKQTDPNAGFLGIDDDDHEGGDGEGGGADGSSELSAGPVSAVEVTTPATTAVSLF
jgi:PRTRC genetic system protein E